MIARVKSPALPGDTRCRLTLCPPADCPAIVTLCGSPPNARDVVSHPDQRGTLIEESIVAG